MIDEDEFLKYLPRCAKCDEVFMPGGKSTDVVSLSFTEEVRGRREVVESNLYHPACAPLKQDGGSYAPGTLTFIHREAR